MKFFMSIYFKLLYVDNHSKDLLAEINFLFVQRMHKISDDLAIISDEEP